MKRAFLLSVLGFAVMGSAASPLLATKPQSDSPAAGAMAKLRDALVETLEHQDLEGSIALYEPDAVFLSPEGRFPDRAAIRTLYHSIFLNYRGQIALTSKKLVASDALCVDDGTYTETITEVSTGKRTSLTGSYVLVARKQATGGWKIAEIVWTQSSSAPA